jgi:very-long-chain enoyl-CoA reductase
MALLKTFIIKIPFVVKNKRMKVIFGYKEFELPGSTTYQELVDHIQVEFGVPADRQNIKADGAKVSAGTDFKTVQVVTVKDYGPQFSYRGVFFWEYFGPIAIVAGFRTLMSGSGDSYAPAAWIIHFLKREFETFFVHRFSRETMPKSNLYKNCTYYYTFALLVGYQICTGAQRTSSLFLWALWLLCQASNVYCHLLLRANADKKDEVRRPPKSIFFDTVCCPNYTAEILGWLIFSFATGSTMGYLFTACGFAQMLVWARQKQAGYKASIPGFSTKALIPYLL